MQRNSLSDRIAFVNDVSSNGETSYFRHNPESSVLLKSLF